MSEKDRNRRESEAKGHEMLCLSEAFAVERDCGKITVFPVHREQSAPFPEKPFRGRRCGDKQGQGYIARRVVDPGAANVCVRLQLVPAQDKDGFSQQNGEPSPVCHAEGYPMPYCASLRKHTHTHTHSDTFTHIVLPPHLIDVI